MNLAERPRKLPWPSAAVLLIDGEVADRIEVAATFARRFRGLMFRRRLPAGLLLTPERSVHGMWMRVPLDVAALAADGEVLETAVLRPWRATRSVPDARHVLEAPLGSFARWGLAPGSVVDLADT